MGLERDSTRPWRMVDIFIRLISIYRYVGVIPSGAAIFWADGVSQTNTAYIAPHPAHAQYDTTGDCQISHRRFHSPLLSSATWHR